MAGPQPDAFAGVGGIQQGEGKASAAQGLFQPLAPVGIAAARIRVVIGGGGFVLVKQPGVEGVALLPLGRPPGQHQQQPRPGGGHVGEAFPLLQLSLQLVLPGGKPSPPVAIQMQIEQGIAAAGLPAHADPLGPAAVSGGLPEVGADHHRVFQALAAVHRHHRHRRVDHVAVGLVGFGHIPVGLEPPAPQPVGRCRRPQLVGVETLRHQRGALLQIGQQPPSEREPGQAPLLQQAGQHPEQSAAR